LLGAHSTRLLGLVILPIRALLSWRISELSCGNDAFLGLHHFPAVGARIVRHIRSEG
jgi:hypothetical protein